MTTTRLLPWHEMRNRPSKIAIRVRAASLGDLVAEAGRALAQVELMGADCVPGGHLRPIRISASDRVTLLSDWLSELIFLADAKHWIAADFTIDLANDTEIRARVSGVTLEQAPSHVETATVSSLKRGDVPGELEAEIVLDVGGRYGPRV